MNKKGALNLSIQLIVVIVIAFVVLGLGLAFVQGMFGDLTGLSESTFQRISEQLGSDLVTSDASLLFSQTRITLDRGESTLEGFGVRNDGDARIKYGFKIETFNCPSAAEDASGCPDVTDWFEYFVGDQQYELKPAERQVNKVQISIPRSAATGLYLLKLSAYLGTWTGDDCASDYNDEVETGCTILGQTELFLTVS